VVGGESWRELLLQLVNGADRLYAVQPVDGDRPTEPAGAATHSVRLVVGRRRVQWHRVPVGRGRPVPNRLPGTGTDGVQHQQAGRTLHPVPVVPARPRGPHAARSAPAQNRRTPHTPVSQVHQGDVYEYDNYVFTKAIRVITRAGRQWRYDFRSCLECPPEIFRQFAAGLSEIRARDFPKTKFLYYRSICFVYRLIRSTFVCALTRNVWNVLIYYRSNDTCIERTMTYS